MRTLQGRVILVAGLCFLLLGIFLACSVSVGKSPASIIGTPLYVASCFCLGAVRILPLSLNFAILILMSLRVGLFVVSWFGPFVLPGLS